MYPLYTNKYAASKIYLYNVVGNISRIPWSLKVSDSSFNIQQPLTCINVYYLLSYDEWCWMVFGGAFADIFFLHKNNINSIWYGMICLYDWLATYREEIWVEIFFGRYVTYTNKEKGWIARRKKPFSSSQSMYTYSNWKVNTENSYITIQFQMPSFQFECFHYWSIKFQ